MTRVSGLGAILFLAFTGTAQAYTATTTVLGPFTGPGATKHAANASIQYYGTDLGFAYQHGSNIQFMFGDTLANEAGDPIQASTGGDFDDAMGSVPTGLNPDTFISAATIPKIKIAQNTVTNEAKAFNPGHLMEFFKTPVGGFSNGTREFGIFYTSKPEGCTGVGNCNDHHSALTCDTGLGFFGNTYDDQAGFTGGCIDNTWFCLNDTMFLTPGSGFCRDESSTVFGSPASASGRIMATALKHRILTRSTADERNYGSGQEWLTNKFMNVAVATVQNFQSTTTVGRDYSVASSSGANRRVFLWGRPGFIGNKAKGRRLGLYFAFVDMPAGSTVASWTLNYYSGGGAIPTWTTDEKLAAPVDLDATTAGIQTNEPHDIINQTSVVWSATLGRWVMFYGGGSTNLPTVSHPGCGVVEFFQGADCTTVDMGNGAFRMRLAVHPWGPWSPPQDIIAATDPDVTPLSVHYKKGGMLRHPDCATAGGVGVCAPHTNSAQFNNADEYGFWYGASIVAPWLKDATGGGVNVTWLASTWDPYRVVMLKTKVML